MNTFTYFMNSLAVMSIFSVFLPSTSFAAGGSIYNTELYTLIAKGCKEIDLGAWRHATKNVLLERGAKIRKVEICNGGVYPIFYTEFQYDPQLEATDDYFSPLYSKLLEANGRWSYSIVDIADRVIINIRPKERGGYYIGLESY